jgi:hypothetical protein
METLSFSEALCRAEAQARSTLDGVLHERLSCAVALVQEGRVVQADDGAWTVESRSQPGKTYAVNGVCQCDDHHYNKPPRGLCKHRLAMFLVQRVLSLMAAPQPAREPASSLQVTEGTPVVVDAPQPRGEAPASVNVRLTIDGRDCQLTLRDADEGRLLERLAAVLAQYPAPHPPPPAQGKEWCGKHNVQMRWNEGKHGEQGWFSHRTTNGVWCKGARHGK